MPGSRGPSHLVARPPCGNTPPSWRGRFVLECGDSSPLSPRRDEGRPQAADVWPCSGNEEAMKRRTPKGAEKESKRFFACSRSESAPGTALRLDRAFAPTICRSKRLAFDAVSAPLVLKRRAVSRSFREPPHGLRSRRTTKRPRITKTIMARTHVAFQTSSHHGRHHSFVVRASTRSEAEKANSTAHPTR
jgi:hypothetical protein